MSTDDFDLPIRPFAAADLLLVLPFVWQLGFAFWANDVTWRPLGLPFIMAWQMAGIVFTTLVVALRYRLDRDRPEHGHDAENAA
ncbi:MAG: DUF3311 domain-containing protein [Sphingomonadales bacterium]|nr:MAG: DUF3311 domain-containing protein [Sphingomonadales bacterium]